MESDPVATVGIIKAIYPRAGHAHVIGITGPPGAGKSSLVDKLAGVYRQRGQSLGVIAVDPSSPFTGGALLGDRIRMQDRFSDSDVFIRSMASRGQPGGLAKASQNVATLMDAMAKDVVLIETVGVGQEEIDIIRVADTIVVVMVPGLGDAVQAMKAGLLEVADILVVNKADREEAERVFQDLRLTVHLTETEGRWTPPVLKTTATENEGIGELLAAIDEHLAYLRDSGKYGERRRRAAEAEIGAILRERLLGLVMQRVPSFGDYADQVGKRQSDPYSAVDRILREAGISDNLET